MDAIPSAPDPVVAEPPRRHCRWIPEHYCDNPMHGIECVCQMHLAEKWYAMNATAVRTSRDFHQYAQDNPTPEVRKHRI